MELPREVKRVLADQSGVIARWQAHAGGLNKHDIDRLLRRREWVRVEPGVFVNHTGVLTWLQRAWIGVLYYWPAALAGASAMRANAGPGWRLHRDDGPVWIAVTADRHVSARPGYRIRYLAHYEEQVQTHTHPPRMHPASWRHSSDGHGCRTVMGSWPSSVTSPKGRARSWSTVT